MVQDMHTKKHNMTRTALQKNENEINNTKNSITDHLLPKIKQTGTGSDQAPTHNTSPPKGVKSYSDMVRKHTTHSTIVIQAPKSDDTSPDAQISAPKVINRITQHISQSNHAATIQKTATTNKDKNIILKFNKTDDVDKLAVELRDELGLNARSRKPLLPKMTISHIPSHIDPQDDLLTHIIENNPKLSDPLREGQLKFLFSYKTRDFSSAVIRVTPHVRSLIKSSQNTIIIGSRACPCLLYTSPSPRDGLLSRMPSSA